MTDDEIKKILEDLVKMFGDKLPDPTHYPKIFEYYVKLYIHTKKNES